MRFALFLSLLLPVSGAVQALESDRKQPVEIQADRAQLDEKTGEARYEGTVVLVQGSLTIHADTLVIKADDNNQLSSVSAAGQPADFSQIPEQGKPPVTARALTIDYDVAGETLLLQGNAVVVQNGNVFQGERIQYDIPRQRMQATGRTDKGGGRVRMTLPPTDGPGTGSPRP